MTELTVALGGLGAIGLPVARALDAGDVPGLRLSAVSARDVGKAEARVAGFRAPPPVVAPAELAARAEVVVEAAPATVFMAIAEPAVAAGRVLLPLSVGALLSHPELIEQARRTGARLVVPSGAILGLDAVRAAAEGDISSVTMVTRKPPGGLAGAPYLQAQGIDLDGIDEPVRVFAGSAREAAQGFPANINVAAALSLAGIGPDRTRVEIWADPTVSRNVHSIRVDGDAARFEMSIENIPSAENPRTGRLTALSTLATLRGLVAPLHVGA